MDILKEFGKYFDSIEDDVKREIFSEEVSVDGPSAAGGGSSQSKPKKLKRELAGLMGMANMKYAEGMHEEAIKLSMEVIRNAPHVPDPFQLLAVIFEDIGQFDKSLQYLLIAAHLSKNNSGEWLSVAERCIGLKNLNLAVFCYEKACRIEPNNEQLWEKKCELMKEAGCDEKKILECYRHILSIKSIDDGESYMNLARSIFDRYISLKENEKAKETILTVINLHPHLITPSDFNRVMDLQFADNEYAKSLELLVKHFGVTLVNPPGESNDVSSVPESVILNENLHVDLRAKLLVCLIHLKMLNGIDPIVDGLMAENCEDVGDLHLDVAEALMSENLYTRAEPLLLKLTGCPNFNMAAVWLRYAECLEFLHKCPEALAAYERVVELAPDLDDARIRLSNLHGLLGNSERAIAVLSAPFNSCEEPAECNLQLLISKCLVLYRQGDFIEFIDASINMLHMCCKQVLIPKYATEAENNRTLIVRRLVFRHTLNNIYNDTVQPREIPNITSYADDIWELYLKLGNILLQLKKYEELDRISVQMIVCPIFFHDSSKSSELEFVCLTAGIANRNASFAYPILRIYLLRDLSSNRAWNLFGQVIAMSQDLRHNRFCIRLAMKHPENMALCVLNGHNAMVAGSYKHALGEYFACLQRDPCNPFYHFMIAITFTHLASQKFCSHRHKLTIQACAYFNQYLNLRGPCQEVYYNIGRALHQLGLTLHAVAYYEKALTYGSVIPGNEMFDLTREIAFNLYLIYCSSESYDMARYIIQEYIKI